MHTMHSIVLALTILPCAIHGNHVNYYGIDSPRASSSSVYDSSPPLSNARKALATTLFLSHPSLSNRLGFRPVLRSAGLVMFNTGGAVLDKPIVESPEIKVARERLEALFRGGGNNGGDIGGGGGGGGGEGKGRGGGGGGDDSEKRLKLLDYAEQAHVLEKWIDQTRVYQTAGDFGTTKMCELHRRQLHALQELRSYKISSKPNNDPDFILALCDSKDQILGLVGAKAGWAPAHGVYLSNRLLLKGVGGSFKVEHLLVQPKKLHDGYFGGAEVLEDLISAVTRFRNSIGRPLDLTKAKENGHFD